MISSPGFFRGRTLILLLLTLPRCTCLGCGTSSDSGCGSDTGGGGCTSDFGAGPCPVPEGTHTISAKDSLGECTLECEPGWFDCDHNSANGCETANACPLDSSFADSGPKEQLLATLGGAPRGLAACDPKHVYFFDDDALGVVDGTSVSLAATSSGMPSGGLACDATNVYWATLSDSDSGLPDGNVWALAFDHDAAAALASNVNPGRGIDVRSSRVYWIARSPNNVGPSMLTYSLFDAGTFAEMPATESEAYKAFALSYDGDYSLANGQVWFSPLNPDAGPTQTLSMDASAASALFAGAGGAYAIVHGPFSIEVDAGSDASDDASDADTSDADDASSDDASSSDASDDADASDAAVIDASVPVLDSIVGLNASFVASGLPRIVTTMGTGVALVASDSTIFYVDLPTNTVSVLVPSALHVVDVAMDATYGYWTTRGEGTTPGAVWRIVLP